MATSTRTSKSAGALSPRHNLWEIRNMRNIAAVIAIATASPALATGFAEPRVEHEVIKPNCVEWFLFIPIKTSCNITVPQGSDDGGETTTIATHTPRPAQPTPTDPSKPETEAKAKKTNASANNRRGGNYEKTGMTDSGKGRGRTQGGGPKND